MSVGYDETNKKAAEVRQHNRGRPKSSFRLIPA